MENVFKMSVPDLFAPYFKRCTLLHLQKTSAILEFSCSNEKIKVNLKDDREAGKVPNPQKY